MSAMSMWAKALSMSQQSAHIILPDLIMDLGERYTDRVALIGDTEQMTYRQLAHRVSLYAQCGSVFAGQTVAMLMHNSSDYVALWLGLTRVGCIVALLNTSLRGQALAHCINISGAEWLVTDDESAPVADEIAAHITAVKVSVEYFSAVWAPNNLPTPLAPLPDPNGVALLIYTSGTTGFPKAARITHRRITEWSFWFSGMTNAKPDDRLYDCLPMYHSVGGVVAVGSMLVSGASVVIRRRFSASRFWHDVRTTECSIFQYIGEICRYLTQMPPSDDDRHHRLRLAVGNGLQNGVWQTFKQRFGVPHILEYYAATEGVVSLYNCEGKPGSVGRIPPILTPHLGVSLIHLDDNDEPVRGGDGFCIRCAADEPGEAIGLIKPNRGFDGYDDMAASDRKILHNVFAEGDRWFRTGDLMRQDRAGFFYFVDRLGDTFRWKGENVSTSEVASVIRAAPGVADAVVYGVAIPGEEGRAGMAAIVLDSGFTWDGLADHLRRQLPYYARPMFIRCCEVLDFTGTFKLAKKRFADEGYRQASEPVWEDRDGTFVPYKP